MPLFAPVGKTDNIKRAKSVGVNFLVLQYRLQLKVKNRTNYR